SQTPRFNQKQPLPYDVIVVDEASMLDLNLATLLFEAVPESCRIILLGDANQLASVDVGAVLADLQQIQALADNRVQLQTSRRFTEGALIGQV
ncbi:AAA family ATPase, partial [Klebsiella pneumoniae]|nr:AAA family ATPase [Klebsiella pneumoniae]